MFNRSVECGLQHLQSHPGPAAAGGFGPPRLAQEGLGAFALALPDTRIEN